MINQLNKLAIFLIIIIMNPLFLMKKNKLARNLLIIYQKVMIYQLKINHLCKKKKS